MILWIVPKWPLPATDGARVATTQLLRGITSLGIEVHLCAQVPKSEIASIDVEAARVELGVASVTLVPRGAVSRAKQLWFLFARPTAPCTFAVYASSSLKAAMQTWVESKPWTVVVYDGLHAAAWAFDRPKAWSVSQEVYRAHNVESELWMTSARDSKNKFKRWVLRWQGRLVKKLETRWAQRVSFIFPVSNADKEKFLETQPRGVVLTLPIGVSVDPAVREEALGSILENQILFVGKLDWAPNRDGLQWFLTHVWPRVSALREDLWLNVVGSGDGSWLRDSIHLPRVIYTGRVERLAPHYQACMATIIPIFYGSGVRVKAVESSLYSRVCVSTSLGVEGTGLTRDETYYPAETADDWVQILATLTRAKSMEMGRLAFDQVREQFDPIRVATKFAQTLHLIS